MIRGYQKRYSINNMAIFYSDDLPWFDVTENIRTFERKLVHNLFILRVPNNVGMTVLYACLSHRVKSLISAQIVKMNDVLSVLNFLREQFKCRTPEIMKFSEVLSAKPVIGEKVVQFALKLKYQMLDNFESNEFGYDKPQIQCILMNSLKEHFEAEIGQYETIEEFIRASEPKSLGLDAIRAAHVDMAAGADSTEEGVAQGKRVDQITVEGLAAENRTLKTPVPAMARGVKVSITKTTPKLKKIVKLKSE